MAWRRCCRGQPTCIRCVRCVSNRAIAVSRESHSPTMNEAPDIDLFRRLTELNQIGIALSREKDIGRLLEAILVAAKQITHADGGTLYRKYGDELRFEIILNDSLGIAMGGTTGKAIPYPPIR